MFRSLSRFFVAALIVASGVAMSVAPFDADAARVGGGTSSGRQSSNVTNKSAPATTSTATPAKPAAAPAATAPAAAAPKPAGASRWLGPLAGIAAGIGGSGAAGSGVAQPAQQRRQVHREGPGHDRDRAGDQEHLADVERGVVNHRAGEQREHVRAAE